MLFRSRLRFSPMARMPYRMSRQDRSEWPYRARSQNRFFRKRRKQSPPNGRLIHNRLPHDRVAWDLPGTASPPEARILPPMLGLRSRWPPTHRRPRRSLPRDPSTRPGSASRAATPTRCSRVSSAPSSGVARNSISTCRSHRRRGDEPSLRSSRSGCVSPIRLLREAEARAESSGKPEARAERNA